MTAIKIALTTAALVLALLYGKSVSSAICIDQQSDDSSRFGDSLAANGKYLAIGDTQTNRVVVYRYSKQNKWERLRIIPLPPNPPILNSSANFGYGITHSLAIAGETLVIGKVVSKYQPKDQEKQFYPFQPTKQSGVLNASGLAYTGAVYRTELNSNSPLQRLDQPKAQELAGFSVAAVGGRIAFAVATYESFGYTTVLLGDRRLTVPVGGKIAMNNSSLVAGNTINNRLGKISIFNLASLDFPPRTIEVPMPVAEIAMADKFIVVAEQLRASQPSQSEPNLSISPKTLVVNISDLSTASIAGGGSVSAAGNRLVVSYPATADGEVPGKMELFDLRSTQPQMIRSSSENYRRSLLTKDHLFTVLNRSPKVSICIASLSK
jgi:hypothetical protein